MGLSALPIRRLHIVNAPGVYRGDEGWSWESVRRDYYNLWICVGGGAQLRCGEQTYPVRSGTAFVLPPQMEVRGFGVPTGGQMHNFMAHWRPVEVKERKGAGRVEKPQGFEPLLGVQIHEIDTAMSLIQSLLRHSPFQDELSCQQSEWNLLLLLGLLWRQRQQPMRHRIHMQLYQQMEQMRSGELLFTPVAELAERACASRMHYTRTFQKLFRQAPNRFQIKQRVERACVLLRDTEMTLDHIASSIGYQDVFFFSRQFKREMGMNAAEYRKKVAGGMGSMVD